MHIKKEYAKKQKAEKNESADCNNSYPDDPAVKYLDSEWIDKKYNENKGTFSYQVKCPYLTEYLKNSLNFLFVSNTSRENIDRYIYKNGVYKLVSDEEFKGVIKQYIPMFLHKQRDIDEVFKLLCCDADIKRTPREQLDTNEDIINFQNGLLNIKTWELEPHTSEELTTIQLPCDYDPSEINAPVFMQFINDLTEGDSEKADFLLQFMSICISNLKAPRFKKALFMVGKGNTGKSQLKKLIEKLLGPENYANIDLKDLEGRWGTARMYGKRLTGCNDMQFAAMPELNVFKQITGGDTIKAEFKGGQLFDFIYNGVMWFCTNKMPKFGGDKGEHVYNRIIILECNNVIPEEKQNKFLVDEMYEERSAIINILLTYLKT